MKITYEGWVNHETWCVNYHMNETENLRYWRAVARWHARQAGAAHPKDKRGTEARHAAAVSLARDISRHLLDDHPLSPRDIYGELLNSALNEVDYTAIARELLRVYYGDEGEAHQVSDSMDSLRPMTYETYTAFLWATADGHAIAHWYETGRYCQEEAQRQAASSGRTSGPASLFAETLRDQLPGIVTDGTSPVQSAFIDCALSRVNWQMLAVELLRVYGVTGADEPGDAPRHAAAPEMCEATRKE
jgi:hypothetical protein